MYSADISSLYLLQRGKLHETETTLEAACRAADVVITGKPSLGTWALVRAPVRAPVAGRCGSILTRPRLRRGARVGVPTQDYRLPVAWVRPNAVVINVSSFKNVDEDALLQVPGVQYVPQVGRVTVAMLERNLLRLYENFHRHPVPPS